LNERILAPHSKFAPVLARSEHFLQALSSMCKLCGTPIHLSDAFQFSSATLLAMNKHFEVLVAGAVAICPEHDHEGSMQEDNELLYELNRLRNN